jgi:hypothetical protein
VQSWSINCPHAITRLDILSSKLLDVVLNSLLLISLAAGRGLLGSADTLGPSFTSFHQ